MAQQTNQQNKIDQSGNTGGTQIGVANVYITSKDKIPKIVKIILIVLLIVLCIGGVFALIKFFLKNSNGFEYENFWVVTNNDGKTVTISILQPTEEINIPPVVTDKDGKSYTVTSIGEAQMADNYKVQTVSLPNGIIIIEAGAFRNFNSLKQITLPDGIETIGQDAFWGCSQLQTVNVNSLESWCSLQFDGENSNPLSVAENSKLTVGNKQFVGDLEIPDHIDTLPDFTFHNSGITSVKFSENVTTIGKEVFANCTDLTNIELSDEIETIGQGAFLGCSQLQTVNVNSLESWCNIQFDGENSNPLSASENSKLTVGNKQFVGDLEIPDNIDTLPDFTFHNSGITSVKFSENVTTIGKDVFANCTSLIKVTIPDAEGYIGRLFGAANSENQQNYLPQSLKEVTILGGESIGNNAFYGCGNLTNITIPNSVTAIEESAFYGCSGLTYINLPIGVTKIGDQAFCGCSGLTSLTLPSAVTTIGKDVFANCTSLRKVTIPNAESYIGRLFGATSYDDQQKALPQTLKEVTILGGKSIGNNAFYGCGNLTNITIPNSVTAIEESAFYGCSGLTDIILPAEVTKIGDQAFCECSGLTSLTLSSAVTTIGKDVFANCTSLRKVTIPTAESYIGRLFGATSYVDQQKALPQSLKEVTILGGESIGSNAFYGCSNLTNITIPNSITTIYYEAFYGCSGLTDITIPNSVTTINDRAFYGCNNLIHIDMPQNITSIGYFVFDSTAFYNDKNSWQNGALYLGPYLLDVKNDISGYFSVKQGTKTIADWAFFLSDISQMNIPASVLNIGSAISLDCEKLEGIEVDPANPNYYSSGNCLIEKTSEILIAGCAKSVIPNGVVAIGYGAFWGQSELKSITLPVSVTKLESFAFSDCTRLSEIKILGALETIDDYAFDECRSLTEITLPNSVTSIGYKAFYGCTSLRELVIPDSVTSVGSYAFSGCTQLMSIVIGKGVTRMGSAVFENCSSLTIYCKVGEKLSGWSANWNPDNRPVVWNYTKQ